MSSSAARLSELSGRPVGRCKVAYALVPSSDGRRLIAVELHEVEFKAARFLEANGDPEHRRLAADRLCDAIDVRTMDDRGKGWV